MKDVSVQYIFIKYLSFSTDYSERESCDNVATFWPVLFFLICAGTNTAKNHLVLAIPNCLALEIKCFGYSCVS